MMGVRKVAQVVLVVPGDVRGARVLVVEAQALLEEVLQALAELVSWHAFVVPI